MVSINEDGSAVALLNRENGGSNTNWVDFYTRTSTTWTLRNSTNPMYLGRVSGLHAICYEGFTSEMWIY
jgi:hypothetical protein